MAAVGLGMAIGGYFAVENDPTMFDRTIDSLRTFVSEGTSIVGVATASIGFGLWMHKSEKAYQEKKKLLKKTK